MVLTEYTILHKGKVLHKNLTEEEYFDADGGSFDRVLSERFSKTTRFRNKNHKVLGSYYGSSFKGWIKW